MGETSFLPASHVESLDAIQDGYWWFLARTKWAKRLIRPWRVSYGKPIDYLDVGCGTGGFAQSMVDEFSFTKTLLIDGDEGVAQKIRQKSGLPFSFKNFNRPLDLPWSPSLITCMDVLEHMEDDLALAQKLSTALRPGGLAIFSVPALPWLFSQWDESLGHHRRYTKSSLRLLLTRAGFKVESIQYMWSFLVPIGPYRKMFGKKYEQAVEFEQVPGWINSSLVKCSDFEWGLSKAIPLPWGTSLIASASL